MKKIETVKSNIKFNEIINKGKKKGNIHFTIFYMESINQKSLFGVTAPKKCGNAVIRNKLKRQTRALLDETKLLFKNKRNYIIIIKKSCLTSSYEDKLNSLKQLIGEINEK